MYNQASEMRQMVAVGDKFHEETKYYRGKPSGGTLNQLSRPSTYKHYPESMRFALPPPQVKAVTTFAEAVKKRRSVRSFTRRPINKTQLSYLLWASTGIQRRESGFEFRTVPSAGALYPIETYLIAHNVEELKRGVYHYAVKSHDLELLKLGDFTRDIYEAALEQEMCSRAAVVFVWTAIVARSKWKYRQRAYRYIYLDTGHIAQNLALSAVNIGLGSCQIGAFYDDEVNQIVDVDGIDESVIYLSAVGNPSKLRR